MITTEAWVLPRGPSNPVRGELRLQRISFKDPGCNEVLAEPLYGCWEGNMTHALRRDPIDICRQRGEDHIVLGNAGVVRVLSIGSDVRGLREGDLCGLASGGEWDIAGYPKTILGYDAPHSLGVLAKRIKLRADQLFRLPSETGHGLGQWAAFTVRYLTAWDNWQVAWGAWRLQMAEVAPQDVHVWSWGGGVGLGELLLARRAGCQAVMVCGSDARLGLCQTLGLDTLDRRQFPDLSYHDELFHTDLAWRQRYVRSERAFLREVEERTSGRGVSIFIDNIGGPVYRATLRALGRQGVITTTGWKAGMDLPVIRARECISRHLHVFTHGARNTHGAADYAERTGWLPPVDVDVTPWDEIPSLAARYERGEVSSYFPVFRINPP